MAVATRPAGRTPRPRANRFELYSWYSFRVSGLLLIVLALGHWAIMHLVNGVDAISYSFVAERWRMVGWRVYDWLLLALALTHGMNGLRVVIDDRVHRPRSRRSLLIGGWAVYLAVLVLGTLAIATFRDVRAG